MADQPEMMCEVSTDTFCDGCARQIVRVSWSQCDGCRSFDLCHLCKNMSDLWREHQETCSQPGKKLSEVNYTKDLQSGVLSKVHVTRMGKILSDGIETNRDVFILLKGLKDFGKEHQKTAAVRLLEYLEKSSLNKIRILALDGGGIRALLTLKVLEYLAVRGLNWNVFLTSVDYFAGTSSGALIAFALCTDFPLHELINIFDPDLLKGKSCTRWPILSSQYDPKLIHNKIKEVIFSVYQTKFLTNTPSDEEKQRILQEFTLGFLQTHWFDEKGRKGGLIINAYDCTSSAVRIFNSKYEPHRNFKVFDILTASMAAPIYFPMKVIKIDEEDHILVDGGVYANNPELSGLWAAYLDSKVLGSYRILSLGTGLGPSKFLNLISSRNEGIPGWIFTKRIFDVMIESNMSFSSTLTRQLASFLKIRRFRFNCRFPESVSLDQKSFPEVLNRHMESITRGVDLQSLQTFIGNNFTDPDRVQAAL